MVNNCCNVKTISLSLIDISKANYLFEYSHIVELQLKFKKITRYKIIYGHTYEFLNLGLRQNLEEKKFE